ncbi:hypothetical protein [Nocardioides sp.]|uniref:hypothetical protein n=1 Tax=Nocardioides sp. TaxID=35761 RepID=UPI002B884BF4|nr:hypothetical protein [Nocardioides sp.]HXH78442.1 hypothetical protein [Nocardioides sp.]
MTGRFALGALGALVMGYGAVLALTRQDLGQLAEVTVWLAVGVLVHDGLLSAGLLVAGYAGRRLLPAAWRAPAAVALVVWGTLTVVAIPVLGRFGARADNPTLLDRPYLASWLVLLCVTVAAVVVAGTIRSRTTDGPPAGPVE